MIDETGGKILQACILPSHFRSLLSGALKKRRCGNILELEEGDDPMKFTIEQVPEGTENEVIIRCNTIDKSVCELIQFLELPACKLLGEIDKEMHILDFDKVFYIESVDNKVFIYGENQVYESRKKLYELEAELEQHHFFRASKSMILNISKIESVRPLFDGRFQALLKNKEKVYISRNYVSDLKKKLGIVRRV